MIEPLRNLKLRLSREEEDDEEPESMTLEQLIKAVHSLRRKIRKIETWQTYYDGAFVVVGVVGYAVFDKVFG